MRLNTYFAGTTILLANRALGRIEVNAKAFHEALQMWHHIALNASRTELDEIEDIDPTQILCADFFSRFDDLPEEINDEAIDEFILQRVPIPILGARTLSGEASDFKGTTIWCMDTRMPLMSFCEVPEPWWSSFEAGSECLLLVDHQTDSVEVALLENRAEYSAVLNAIITASRPC